MSGVDSSVPANFLEIHGVQVAGARLELSQPPAESQEAHPTAFEPLRSE
jgi:tRNA U34 2-thiouridine synthase MnmA/TrmU